MGEYAEAILNGEVCEGCGEELGRGQGFTRQCEGCIRRERREKAGGFDDEGNRRTYGSWRAMLEHIGRGAVTLEHIAHAMVRSPASIEPHVIKMMKSGYLYAYEGGWALTRKAKKELGIKPPLPPLVLKKSEREWLELSASSSSMYDGVNWDLARKAFTKLASYGLVDQECPQNPVHKPKAVATQKGRAYLAELRAKDG